MAEDLKKEREEKEALNYRSHPSFLENERAKENERLIAGKGLAPGKKIRLIHLDMDGEIIEIRHNSLLPVIVKREDGEKFPYNASEVEVIK